MSQNNKKKTKNLLKDVRAISDLGNEEYYERQELDYAAKHELIRNKHYEEDLEEKKQNRLQRKDFANKIFWMLCIYLVLVFAVLGLVGFEVFTLRDSVLIALITTTTLNVIGIFNFVAKYLFHTKETKE